MSLLLPILIVLLTSLFIYWKWNQMVVGNLKDKFVLVTGCDSGFGHLVVQKLDALGMNVIACCLTEKGMTEVAAKTSRKTITIRLDVTEKYSIEKCKELVKKILPENEGLWGLINNAGISGPVVMQWSQPEDYRTVMAVNFFGMVDMVHAFLPMIKKAKGRIVNVASMAGRTSLAGGPYGASKFAVEVYSDGLRRWLSKSGVKVVILEPGAFITGLTNEEVLKKNIDSSWEKLPVEDRAELGEEGRVKMKKTYLNIIKYNPLTYWNKPEMVADKMVKALTINRPSTRYTIGLDAKLFYVPLSVLPDAVADFILSPFF